MKITEGQDDRGELVLGEKEREREIDTSRGTSSGGGTETIQTMKNSFGNVVEGFLHRNFLLEASVCRYVADN